MRARKGFTFIELLTVVIVIGVLAGLAIPRYRDVKRRAYAAQAVSDFGVVRVAAYNYYADHGAFPGDFPAGITPAPLVPYLPKNFDFHQDQYDLDFDSFPASSGSGGSSTEPVLAITMRTGNTALVSTVAQILRGGSLSLVLAGSITYIIAGL